MFRYLGAAVFSVRGISEAIEQKVKVQMYKVPRYWFSLLLLTLKIQSTAQNCSEPWPLTVGHGVPQAVLSCMTTSRCSEVKSYGHFDFCRHTKSSAHIHIYKCEIGDANQIYSGSWFFFFSPFFFGHAIHSLTDTHSLLSFNLFTHFSASAHTDTQTHNQTGFVWYLSVTLHLLVRWSMLMPAESSNDTQIHTQMDLCSMCVSACVFVCVSTRGIHVCMFVHTS